MNIKEFTKKFISSLSPSGMKEAIDALINHNENLNSENIDLKRRNQELEDQVRMLKGEKPVPKFKGPKNKTSDRDERKTNGKNQGKKQRRKKEDLKIDETKRILVPKENIPLGFIHKGYRRVSIQEILFERHNICFELERYYNPDTKEFIEAKIPIKYRGSEFGPTLRSFIIGQYFDSDSTHQKIKKLLSSIDVDISTSGINNILINTAKEFEDDLSILRDQAIERCDYQNIDDTSGRVLGARGCYTIVTGNPFFTQFLTAPGKSRYWAINALSGKRDALYRFNEVAIDYAVGLRSSTKLRIILKEVMTGQLYDERRLKKLFESKEFNNLSPPILNDIKIGMYIAALRNGDLGYCGNSLMSDDAGQFNYIYYDHALCWVHELRHYKLIECLYTKTKEKVDHFIKEAWSLYDFIKKARRSLNTQRVNYAIKEFKRLFMDGKTGIKKLDAQRELTSKKIDKLLAPLFNQKLPLHNNDAELDIRGRVIKRKISLFNKSWRGAHAWDIFCSLKESCRKLGLNFYQYVREELHKISRPKIQTHVFST